MKKLKLLIVVFFLLSISGLVGQNTFTLTSDDLGGQMTKKQVFNGFGCTGKNQSPQLRWENIPKGTKSFAITMYDPDAPTGSGWWHWIVFDIPASTTELVANAGNVSLNLTPEGTIQSINSFDTNGYGGPCPPIGHGIHRYVMTVYALRISSLGLNKEATPAIVGYTLWNNTIEKASIIAYYQRN